jgi:hypothetical protein
MHWGEHNKEAEGKMIILFTSLTVCVCIVGARCDPMRVTKKFTGKSWKGKKLFKRSGKDNGVERRKATEHLEVCCDGRDDGLTFTETSSLKLSLCPITSARFLLLLLLLIHLLLFYI